MTIRAAVLVLAALLVSRPVHGQRLADLPPAYIPVHAMAPVSPPPFGCSVGTRAMWAVGGAIMGVMAGMMVLGIMAGDSGPSAAHRRQTTFILSGGALVGGVVGWFTLADRYSCG